MNGDTRLSEALKASPAILDYIVSLNPHDFTRLHNPLLAKVMPPRITLRRIAAMVGMPVAELVARLNELAGIANHGDDCVDEKALPSSAKEPPAWYKDANKDKILWVDVTSIDANHGDPMPPINIAINGSNEGDIIGIKHMWEPQPFYDIWHARGFEFWSQQQHPDLWYIFVHRPKRPPVVASSRSPQ